MGLDFGDILHRPDVDGCLLLVPGEDPDADPGQAEVDQGLPHPVLQLVLHGGGAQ